MRRTILLACAACWALASASAAVMAHAEPVRIRPGDGAVLNSPPSSVEIEMTQDMARIEGANDIDVFDSSGTEVTVVSAVIDNGNRRRLSVPLPSLLPPGIYTVKWKSLSADDGDTAKGTLSFAFDPARPPSAGREVLRTDILQPPGGTEPSEPGPTLDASRGATSGTSWILVVAAAAGMAVVGGGAAFMLAARKT